MAKITINIDSVDSNSDGFTIDNDGATVPQIIGAISMLARYLTDNTHLTVRDIVKVIKSSSGLEKII